MAYTKNVWADGDVITADKLNNIENGIGDVPAGAKGDPGEKGDTGEKGDPGEAGQSIKAIALKKDADGNVTGGTATLSDDSTLDITVTSETA
jgi:hypothetical protein